MFKKIYKTLFGIFDRYFRTWWSNHRWRNVVRHDTSCSEKIQSIEDISLMSNYVFHKFKWVADGADQLFDSTPPPPYAYLIYNSLGNYSDDCDGYHSLMYHMLSCNDIECYLLYVIALCAGHCVLLFKLNETWHILDYNRIECSGKTTKEVIEEYNKIYVKKYNIKREVFYNSLIKYDYKAGEFIFVE